MKAPLARLVGMSLVSVDNSGESCGFVYDGCTLSSFNPVRFSAPVQELVEAKVSSVIVDPGKCMYISFEGGSEFAVSLADADYTGPEAFVVHFGDGTVVAA